MAGSVTAAMELHRREDPFFFCHTILLLAGIFVHDLLSLRKVHNASLAAIMFAIALNVLGTRVAESNFGLELVRGLA